MKKVITTAFAMVLALVVFSGALHSQSKRANIYFEKSGTVVYKYSGTTKGTSTLYFDNYGKKRAEFSKLKTTVFGFSSEENKLELFDGKWVYSIDMDKKTGSKVSLDDVENYQKATLGTEDDREKLAEDMWKAMGGKKTGTATFLGKKCDIWEATSPQMKAWVWQNIPLKSEASIMGITVKIEATKIDMGSVSTSKFKIPKGVKITEEEMPEEMPNFFGK